MNIQKSLLSYMQKMSKELSAIFGIGTHVIEPARLVTEMSLKVHEHVKVSKKGSLWSVFDPCCGYGMFLFAAYAYMRFCYPKIEPLAVFGYIYGMDSDPDVISASRYFWIKILVLDGVNENDAKKIVVRQIVVGDALDKSTWPSAWKGKKFDVIIGNPPYNPAIQKTGGTGGRTNLWKTFVEKALDEQLSEGGYLCFVHPPMWRAPSSHLKKSRVSHLWKKLTCDNTLLHLQIERKPFPGAGTRADWYVLQKKKANPNQTTIVVDINGISNEIQLADWAFLPNEMFEEVKLLLAKKDEPTLTVVYSATLYDPRHCTVSKKRSDEFCYPILHATNKTGNRFLWSNTQCRGHFGIAKILFGDSGMNDIVIDSKGELGCSNHCIGIETIQGVNEIEMKEFFLGPAFQNILKAVSFSSFGISPCFFTHLRQDICSTKTRNKQ